MKKFKSLTMLLCCLIFASSQLYAASGSANGQTIGGATGLINVPNANIGWDKTNLGLDLGYHFNNNDNGSSHTPKIALSLFGKGEIGFAADIQDWDGPVGDDDETDYLFHGKFRFYNTNSLSIAAGASFMAINSGSNRGDEASIFRIYAAATYPGYLFTLPSETTITLGKTFGDSDKDCYRGYTKAGNIDFGIGFDVNFLPKYFKNYAHLLVDFANYSYSVQPMAGDSLNRACVDAGFRITPFKNEKRFKWNIDAVLTDALDHSRNITVGTSFGLSL